MICLFCFVAKKNSPEVLFLTEQGLEYVPVNKELSDELAKIYAPKPTGIFPAYYTDDFKNTSIYKSFASGIELSLNLVKAYIKNLFPNDYLEFFKKLDNITFDTAKDIRIEHAAAYAYHDSLPYSSKIIIQQDVKNLTELCYLCVHEILHAVSFDKLKVTISGFIQSSYLNQDDNSELICCQNDCTAFNEAYTQYLTDYILQFASKAGLVDSNQRIKIAYDFYQNILEIVLNFATPNQKRKIEKAYFLNKPSILKATLNDILQPKNPEKIDLFLFQLDTLFRLHCVPLPSSMMSIQEDIKRLLPNFLSTLFELCQNKIYDIQKKNPNIDIKDILDFSKANDSFLLSKFLGKSIDAAKLTQKLISENFTNVRSFECLNTIVQIQDATLSNLNFKIDDKFLSVEFFMALLGQNSKRLTDNKLLEVIDYEQIARNIFNPKNMYLTDDLDKRYKFLGDIVNNSSLFDFDIISCIDNNSLAYLSFKNPQFLFKIITLSVKKAKKISPMFLHTQDDVEHYADLVSNMEQLTEFQKKAILSVCLSTLPNKIYKNPEIKNIITYINKEDNLEK